MTEKEIRKEKQTIKINNKVQQIRSVRGHSSQFYRYVKPCYGIVVSEVHERFPYPPESVPLIF